MFIVSAVLLYLSALYMVFKALFLLDNFAFSVSNSTYLAYLLLLTGMVNFLFSVILISKFKKNEPENKNVDKD